MDKKITKDMTFGKVLKEYPQTVETFFKYGMHCFGCQLAVDETIEQGALAHGVEVDKLIDDLNLKVSEQSPQQKKEDEPKSGN